MMISETEDDTRVHRAAEYLAACREVENVARRRLARAAEDTKRAKEKHETAFMDREARLVAKIRAASEATK